MENLLFFPLLWCALFANNSLLALEVLVGAEIVSFKKQLLSSYCVLSIRLMLRVS